MNVENGEPSNELVQCDPPENICHCVGIVEGTHGSVVDPCAGAAEATAKRVHVLVSDARQ